MQSYSNIDEYLALQEPEIRKKLERLRITIKSIVPEATEVISYKMPAFKLNRILLWFAVFKNHYSIFIPPEVLIEFKNKLIGYKCSKSGIKIAFNKELPAYLIKEIIESSVLHSNFKKKGI